MNISSAVIDTFEQRYRTTFINSLAGFRQAVLIGTRSLKGNTNLAIFNSLIHLGANPSLYGFISRPDSAQRDTLQNILDTGAYTFNYIKSADFKKAHQTSARYETVVSEFEAVGFTEDYKAVCNAPFVKEAVVKIGMKLEDKINIPVNGTTLIIGSIQYVEMDDLLIGSDGFVDLEKAGALLTAGLDAYYKTELVGRLSYAKPDKWPELL